MTEDIAAALRAAQEAIEARVELEGRASAAVAAFLRALPRTIVDVTADGGIVAISAHTLACAVEEAARHE